MKTDTIIAQYTAVRACPSLGYGENADIKVTAKAYAIGSQSPYFSVTAEVFTPARRRRNDCEACGCLHDEVLKYFPKLAPLVALHLSDAITGEPMHGEANGFYWIAGALGGLGELYHGGSGSSGKSAEECARIFRDHCRIGESESLAILEHIKAAFERGRLSVATSEEVTEKCRQEMDKAGNKAAKTAWTSLYHAMLPRFKAEAESGLALIHELNAAKTSTVAA